MTAARKPLPPFANTITRDGDLVTVFQGPESFNAARQLNGIAIPPGQPASAFKWPMVRGRVVRLIESGEVDDDRVRSTAITLIHAGARAVRVTRCQLAGKNYTAAYLPRRPIPCAA